MEINTLAEKVRSGEYEAVSAEDLCREAADFFTKAMELEGRGQYGQGIDYCVAACEDLDIAYKKSDDPDDFETGKRKVSDMQKRIIFHKHRIKANMYVTEKRYHVLLDEVLAAKAIYKELLEDNQEGLGEFESKFSPYECDLRRLEGIARDKIKNMSQLPEDVQSKNKEDMSAKLKIAIAEEKYEDAAVLRDQLKELEGN